jgi:uncharacterized protein (DUF362 family)
MDRRKFIQNSALVASGLFLQSFKEYEPLAYNLVMVRGGSPGAMLDLGLEVLGNAARFVRSGQTVLIKPTIQGNKRTKSGTNTNPELLADMVKHCYDAGAKEVLLLGQTKTSWPRCFANSGIERAVKDAGAKVVPANKESLYEEVEIPNAKVMKKAKIHRAVLETDLIINIPAVKPDPDYGMFGAFRNLMGLVWEEGQNPGKTEQLMVDFLHYRKPVLNVMDLYRVPKIGKKSDATEYKTVILSPDIVSAEVFAAKRLGIATDLLKYLEQAAQAGFGKIDPSKESIRSIVLKNNVPNG